MTNEDLDMILNAGLEKIAENEEQSKLQKTKKWVKNNPKKVGAGIGALGLGAAGLISAKNKNKSLAEKVNYGIKSNNDLDQKIMDMGATIHGNDTARSNFLAKKQLKKDQMKNYLTNGLSMAGAGGVAGASIGSYFSPDKEKKSSVELNMILNAGLEKIAYEEGLNDYADSLEKVAGVHGVDAMDLHDFLEKTAADEVEDPKWKKWGRRGGIAGGIAGGAPMLVSTLKDSNFNVAEAIGASSITGAGGSLAGGLIGAGAGALQPKKKEASIDNDTLNYLFEQGLEALTN